MHAYIHTYIYTCIHTCIQIHKYVWSHLFLKKKKKNAKAKMANNVYKFTCKKNAVEKVHFKQGQTISTWLFRILKMLQ